MNLIFVIAPILVTLLSLLPMRLLNHLDEQDNDLPSKNQSAALPDLTRNSERKTSQHPTTNALWYSPDHGFEVVKPMEERSAGKTVSRMKSVRSIVEFVARANMAAQGYLIAPSAQGLREERD